MTTSVTIPITNLPSEMVLLSEQAVEQRNDLISRLTDTSIDIISSDTWLEANAVFSAADKWLRDIEKEREAIKRPIIVIGNAIQAAAKEATSEVLKLRTKLSTKIGEFKISENRRIEAERRAIAESERIERERRQQEANELQAELDSRAVEQAKLEALPDEEPVLPPTAAAGKVLIMPAEVPRAKMPELLRGSVRATSRQVLEIYDQSQVPQTINGIEVWAKDFHTKQIEVFLKAGIAVPGCHLVVDKTFGSTGR